MAFNASPFQSSNDIPSRSIHTVGDETCELNRRTTLPREDLLHRAAHRRAPENYALRDHSVVAGCLLDPLNTTSAGGMRDLSKTRANRNTADTARFIIVR